MKKFPIYIALMFSTVLGAQTSVFEAIGSGNVDQLVSLMDESIELCFDDKVDFMSKPAARKAMTGFFERNPPQSFNRVHKGNSPGADSKYVIGNYSATNGRKFRVYIFSKKIGSSEVIQELRFDKA